jgi:hypothetical protein
VGWTKISTAISNNTMKSLFICLLCLIASISFAQGVGKYVHVTLDDIEAGRVKHVTTGQLADITNMATSLSAAQSQIGAVSSQVTVLSATVTSLQSAVTGLQATVSENSQDISSLETNVEARLPTTEFQAADSTTNYVRRTGDTMSGQLAINHGNLGGAVTNGFITRATIGGGAPVNRGYAAILSDLSVGRGKGWIELGNESQVSSLSYTGSWDFSNANVVGISNLTINGSITAADIDADTLDGLDSTAFATSQQVANISLTTGEAEPYVIAYASTITVDGANGWLQ